MPILLGDIFPDFSADTNEGRISSFHKWMGSNWAILFSHPADFTPVCTTELARAAQLAPEFANRGVKMIALSCDSPDTHKEWIKDIVFFANNGGSNMKCLDEGSFPFPIIADEKRELAKLFAMLDPNELDSQGIPLTARAVFVIDPDKRMRLSILYPATTGRNFYEILRAIDSLQLTSVKKLATPENWKPGDGCLVLPTLAQDQAAEQFGESIRHVDLPSRRQYMRFVNEK